MAEVFQHNGFTFTKDYKDSSSIVEIEHNKECPEKLFKFYGMSSFSVGALEKGYFYSSHPLELNDILDSSYLLFHVAKPLGFEYYEKLFGGSFGDKEKLYDFYKEDVKNDCHAYIVTFWQILTNKFGIISTTAKQDNTLMWPHYTQERGFQLKFDSARLEDSIKSKLTGNEEYLGLFPVNYSPSLNPIDISQFRQMFIPLYYGLTIKSSQWAYEEEWRFLISKENMGVPMSKSGFNHLRDYEMPKENRFAYYDSQLVEEITLGRNLFNGHDFQIKRSDAKTILVKPKEENNWQYENQKALLEYITDFLQDRIFVSGVKYELDKYQQLYLIRTKERMKVIRAKDGFFELRRTNEVIKT